jgi:hypothetical protein
MLRPGRLNGEQYSNAVDGLTLCITHTHDHLGSLWEPRVRETKKDDRVRDL